jgi:poly(hydroxyalkanoate) depolymerase family esterase
MEPYNERSFTMNDRMREGMNEAMRHTLAGRLAKATETIQRTLRRISNISESPAESSGKNGPFEAVSTPPPTVARGQFVDKVYSNAAGRRAYKLYIPSAYTGQTLPLVVMLHGCTQKPDDLAAGTRMNAFAEKEMFLVAYPEQAASANRSRCWNWFQHAHQHRDEGEPCLIAGITRQIMSAYSVDASRVYIAGISAGGAMAVILAATYPDLYAAVGVHSGIAYRAAHNLASGFAAMRQGASHYPHKLTNTIPLIVFQGDQDKIVAPINADHLLDQWLSGAEEGPGSLHRPAGDATLEYGQVDGGHAYTRFIYHDVHGRIVAEKWIVHQAGHAWSGGSSTGSFTDPKGPDASAEMLRFFHEVSQKARFASKWKFR